MLMVFSQERFMERILAGTKIHTIRLDKKKRWKTGMTSHMWMHSPRNIHKHPFHFANAGVNEICAIKISSKRMIVEIEPEPAAYVNVRSDDVETIARFDGFDSADEFFEYFREFEGRLILWRNLLKFPEVL